jgi:cell division protein FtsB
LGLEGNTTVSRLPRPPLTPLLLAAAVLTIAYFLASAGRNVYHNYQLGQEESQVRKDIAALDRDHAQLAAVRDYLKSDEYIEYTARNTLGLVRPGETLVVVSSSQAPPVLAATPGPQRAANGEWWKDLFAPAIAPAPAATP